MKRIFTAFLFTFLCQQLSAQIKLSGVVTSSKDSLAYISVGVKGQDKQTTMTDGKGHFAFASLAGGSYFLNVSAVAISLCK